MGCHVARGMEMMMPRRLEFEFDCSVPYDHYRPDLKFIKN